MGVAVALKTSSMLGYKMWVQAGYFLCVGVWRGLVKPVGEITNRAVELQWLDL